MKLQSSGHSVLTKGAFLLAVVLFTLVVIYAMLTRQTQYVMLGIAVFILPMIFAKRNSRTFQFTSALVFLLALAYFSVQFGVIAPRIKTFHLVLFFIALLSPIFITKPRTTFYIYVAIILMFSGSSYGLSAAVSKTFFNIYGKGTGILHYTIMNVALYSLFLSTVIHDYILSKRNGVNIECNLFKLFWLYNMVYFIYILVGMGHGVSFADSTHYLTNVVNIVNMTLFVFLVIKLFRTEKDVHQFIKFFLGCMAVKGIYGIYRFMFMGGDPANHYANKRHMRDVVITFFDWGDGIIACIAVFFSLWLLMKGSRMLSKNEKLFYWLVVAGGTFNMLFSYRRTIWAGMVLVIMWLLYHMSFKQRMALITLTLVIGSTVFVTLVQNRFGASDKSILHIVASDAISESTGDLTVKEGRFYELYVAWQKVKKKLLFGAGPWGNMGPDAVTAHSSIMIILLKMGLVGLTIYLAILVAYFRFWLRARSEQWNSVRLRAFGEAGFAGFVFCLPAFFVAPIIPEFRTMLLLGIILALPYVAYHFNRKIIADNNKLDKSDETNCKNILHSYGKPTERAQY